jgi:hypothetical protein
VAEEKCDRYSLVVQNEGQHASSGRVTFTDTLPAGLIVKHVFTGGAFENDWSCIGQGTGTVTCELVEEAPGEGSIQPGHYSDTIIIEVFTPTETSGVLSNEATLQGGGLTPSTVRQETPISKAAAFEPNEFAFQPSPAAGVPGEQAGSHPWSLTTSFGIPSEISPPQGNKGGAKYFVPPHNIKDVAVELPIGFLGDPLATAKCTEVQLRVSGCPKASRVGTFDFINSGSKRGEYTYTEDIDGDGGFTAVYNMVPEAGYPAEFGLDFGTEIGAEDGGIPILMYASVIHTGTGERVRVTSPDISEDPEVHAVNLTFFGQPNSKVLHEGVEQPNEGAAFLSDPGDCTAEAEGLSGAVDDPVTGPGGSPLTAHDDASRIEMDPWGEPATFVSAESTVFPSLTGCGALQFHPSFSLAPSPSGGESASEEGTSEADEPSAYTVDLKVPQSTEADELATPDLRDATVTLPAGVSVSPSAANGLVGCQSEGPEGINVGSDDIGPKGEDMGDPEATELGEGHAGPGGNSSPYDDGFYHTAPGHCPAASAIGTVDACTPDLANLPNSEGEVLEGEAGEKACEENPSIAPLKGHIYLAQPKCGGEGQAECTEASATNGELFGQYIEVAGDGVIAKIPGTVAANTTTGQLTSTFAENPQLPFSDLKLHFKGGPRAPLANPQTCGSFTTNALLEPWSHDRINPTEGTPNAQSASSFEIGGCPATMPFAPAFTAGTSNPAAGQYSPFVLSFSRQDREQDLSGLSETMPPGLVGKIAGIPECPEAQANAGTCGAESQLGTTTATAGSGPEPYVETGGKLYLTGPYGGGPFGLSIVVPTKAGPFNLGNEVVRAAIHINPNTTQVTVVTNPLPQSKDGVPFRLRSVNTEINRPGFILNPTNCAAMAVTGTLSGDLPDRVPGSTVGVSSPYQATGCNSLKFHPEFSASTQAATSKADGASLDVKISYPEPYTSYENVQKVDTSLPLALSSRLTTLNKACTEQQFAANPAGCPAASDVGVAVAHTPILKEPLMGPAILVSHANRAFPDLDIVLQGEGIEIVLTGNTDIKKGITYSKFETVPDAPVSSFELKLPEKEFSILTAVKNLCNPTKTVTTSKKVTKRVRGKLKKVTVKTKKTVAEPLVMPTEITGQNGAKLTQQTKIAVTGCAKAKPAKKVTKKKAKRKAGKKSKGKR